MIKISDVILALEAMANPALQETYDNSGLIIGSREGRCTGVLIALDVTEEIIEEAVNKNCNLIVSHHPIIFKGLKRITGSNYVERCVIQAIRNDIALYAIHTNLDNALNGVNSKIADKLGLINRRVLAEKQGVLKKLVTFVPSEQAETVRQALFNSGAGAIGLYDQCSFNLQGTGTFRPLEGADPFSGTPGEQFSGSEIRIEVVFPHYVEKQLIFNLRKAHPYEEVAFYITALDNTERNTGSGLVGELASEMSETDFLKNLKGILGTKVIRHTQLLEKPVKKVALCGGSGFFLLPAAVASGADIYLTGDIKYHEFFDADGRILLADAGHFETEQFTIELLADYLQNKFHNFAVLKTERQTNPIRYFI